jgi:hypothetical protein
MVVIEQNDEWLVGRRYLSLDSLASLLEERGERSTEEARPEATCCLTAELRTFDSDQTCPQGLT